MENLNKGEKGVVKRICNTIGVQRKEQLIGEWEDFLKELAFEDPTRSATIFFGRLGVMSPGKNNIAYSS